MLSLAAKFLLAEGVFQLMVALTIPRSGVEAQPEHELRPRTVSLESIGYNVFSTLEAPLGWSARSLPQSEALPNDRDQHWLAQTGVAPQDSHFTLIIPIHNEASGLKTFLGTLLYTALSASVDAQIIFVTNDCSDNSAEIVKSTLLRLGDDAQRIDGNRMSGIHFLDVATFKDRGITENPLVVHAGRVQYVHINTSTRGKANALNIGNECALQSDHRVVMSMDSDCCPEPTAVMNMFREMHAAISADGERPPVLSGLGSCEWNWGRELPPAVRAEKARINTDRDFNLHNRGMMGWFMAWDARWLDKIGGVPHAVIEDFALGIQAVIHGGGRRTVDAKIWSYGPTKRADHWGAIARYAQGAFQLRERYADDPQTHALVREETACLASPKRILSRNARELLESTSVREAVGTVYRMTRQFQALVLGWLHNRRDPNSQTWRQLKSTRL